jgi:hypothetical protein
MVSYITDVYSEKSLISGNIVLYSIYKSLKDSDTMNVTF